MLHSDHARLRGPLVEPPTVSGGPAWCEWRADCGELVALSMFRRLTRDSHIG